MTRAQSDITAPLPKPPQTYTHFDDRTALHLSQAFGQELELEPLLALLHAQLQALTASQGLRYRYPPLGIDLNLGLRERHTSEYNLSYRDEMLGDMTLFFARKQHAAEIETSEDVVALAFTALRNAITRLKLKVAPSQSEKALLNPTHLDAQSDKTDTLILLAVDSMEAIKERDGEEWAHILMTSVHKQIEEGLRQADGVYHVGDELIAVLLPHTTDEQAMEVAKKIRLLIASLHLRGNDIQTQLTASMGLAAARGASVAEEVMANAKRALAIARDKGANEIHRHVSSEAG